jgi:NACHT domain- and WD repeat-containing protein
MPQASKTFRIFVSSTFSDLKAERNALQEHVFPRLRELCAKHGCRFQAIDLRWGVSEEASLDQQTIKICLAEIDRCQRVTPRPNFIALLGDRYGWRPLPGTISAEEYETIAEGMPDAAARRLLHRWYWRDSNAVPPEYVLLPRAGRIRDHSLWEREVERPLRAAIATSLRRLEWSADRRLRYEASATEQEIVAGALGVADAQAHVFCFARAIQGLPRDRRAAAFIDLDADGIVDVEAQARLGRLKQELFDRLGHDHAFHYEVGWMGQGPELGHLDRLCEEVYASLLGVIAPQLEETKRLTDAQPAADPHELFRRDRQVLDMRALSGDREPGEKIAAYLAGSGRHCLALLAEPGSGVSGVVARAVEQARIAHRDAHVVARFIGATAESLDGRALLADLGAELRRRYGAAAPLASAGADEIESGFRQCLGLATNHAPLVVFLDGLGQLPPSDSIRALTWVPRELPEHVHLVLSISTQATDCLEAVAARVQAENCLRVKHPGTIRFERGGELLDEYLASVGRTLQDDQREHALARLAVSERPLYIHTFTKFAFEEVRRWRSYDGVPTYRGKPGFAADVEGIFRDLLWRLAVRGSHGQVLVSHSVAYLCASRNGLDEDELLDVLSRDVEVYAEFLARAEHFPPDLVAQARTHLDGNGAADDMAGEALLSGLLEDPPTLRAFLETVLAGPERPRLPIVLWARLHADLEPYLSVRDADDAQLLNFFHRSLHEVGGEDHLAATDPRFFHQRLAAYFAEQPLRPPDTTSANRRRLSELPYQQAKGQLWSELAATLTDFDFLEAKAVATGTDELWQVFELALQEIARDPDGRAQETYAIALLLDAIRKRSAVPFDNGTQLAEFLVTHLGTSQNTFILRLLRQASQRSIFPRETIAN